MKLSCNRFQDLKVFKVNGNTSGDFALSRLKTLSTPPWISNTNTNITLTLTMNMTNTTSHYMSSNVISKVVTNSNLPKT